MENQHQKVVTTAYLLFAVLVAFICLTGMMKVSSIYDIESKVKSIEFIIRGLSVLIGAGAFFFLYKHTQTNEYMNEVVAELLTKVTWPTSQETWAATGVVMITVLIAGFVLGVLDWIWSYLIKAIL